MQSSFHHCLLCICKTQKLFERVNIINFFISTSILAHFSFILSFCLASLIVAIKENGGKMHYILSFLCNYFCYLREIITNNMRCLDGVAQTKLDFNMRIFLFRDMVHAVSVNGWFISEKCLTQMPVNEHGQAWYQHCGKVAVLE